VESERQAAESRRQAAEALESAGALVEAIEAYSEANRRQRDARIERHLVRLRHDAFELLDRSAGPADWPPSGDDPFADCPGIPEISADELTADAIRGGIVHHGSLLVRGLVPPARVQQLIEDIDRSMAAHDERVAGAPDSPDESWFVPFNAGPAYKPLGFFRRKWVREGGGVWTIDSPRALFDLIETFREVGIGEVIEEYLGERPAFAVDKCTLRRVPVDIAGADWHQDGSFLGGGIRTVNVWLALTACGGDADAPGLEIVPRRLQEVAATGTDGATFDWSVGPGMVEKVSDGVDLVRPRFEPGDALLFDELNLHRTATRPGLRSERYAVETWFFAPSRYPADQVPIMF
jgi:hypothetical protein